MVFLIKYKLEKEIEDYSEKLNTELEEFFNIHFKYEKPRIIVVADRETVNQMLKSQTPEWVVGWSEKRNIFILDKFAYVKPVTDEYYFKIIKHEMIHSYFYIASNNCEYPEWLFEGIALYLAGQNKNKIESFKNFLNYYDHKDEGIYKESGFAVEFLIKYYGKGKFLELVRGLKYIASKEKFAVLFKEIYGFELKYENFKV